MRVSERRESRAVSTVFEIMHVLHVVFYHMYVLIGGVCPPLGKPHGGTPNRWPDETGCPSGRVIKCASVLW
nr:hypothetical protein [Candidatus Njordarchaeota archaeon]